MPPLCYPDFGPARPWTEQRAYGPGPTLTPAEAADWSALTAWFATAALPTAPYRVRLALVTDPAAAHAWIREALARGPEGQVRRALLVRLRALRTLCEPLEER
jgi:hypothetical protein